MLLLDLWSLGRRPGVAVGAVGAERAVEAELAREAEGGFPGS